MPGADSARATLRLALSTLLRLFAPIIPFATEEVWSWCQTDDGPLPDFTAGSIHSAPWPTAAPLRDAAGDGDPLVLDVAAEVLGRIRKAKSDAKRSMRSEVDTVVVRDTADRVAALLTAANDVRDAGKVAEPHRLGLGRRRRADRRRHPRRRSLTTRSPARRVTARPRRVARSEPVAGRVDGSPRRLHDPPGGRRPTRTDRGIALGSRSTLRPRLVAFAAAAALATATITSCVNVTPAGNAAFVDVLARDVRGGQAPPWVRDDALRQLAAGTSRSKVVDAAIASQDAHDTVIQDAFRTVLGHPPTFDEESAWLPRLGAAQHESDLYVSLLASDELYAQAGGTNAAVVDRVAELVVGHPLAASTRADAIAQLDAGGSRQSFVRSLWTSADAAGHRVDATYQRLLGRAPTVDERSRWTDTLTSQDTSALTSALAASNEYYSHAATRTSPASWSTPRSCASAPWGCPSTPSSPPSGGRRPTSGPSMARRPGCSSPAPP